MTVAERSFSSSAAIRASSIACSFLASSYSEFSEMSPNSRASLMRSATSRRLSVGEVLDLLLELLEPFGGEDDVLLHARRPRSGPEKEKPAQMRTARCAQWSAQRGMVAPGRALSGDRGPQLGDQRALLGERLGALERVLDGRAPRRGARRTRGGTCAGSARRARRPRCSSARSMTQSHSSSDLVARRGRSSRAPSTCSNSHGLPSAPRASMTAAAARVLEHPADVLGARPCRPRRSPARAASCDELARRGRSPGVPLWRTLTVRGWKVMPATPASSTSRRRDRRRPRRAA